MTVLLDQLAKVWALHALDDGQRRAVLGDLLGLQLLFNPGAAFGTGAGYTIVLTLIALGAVIVLVRTASKLRDGIWEWGFGLFLGGALGNLIDRLFRDPGFGRGHVVAAVAPPAEYELRQKFTETLDPLDAALFEKTLFLLRGLPELGLLLQVEKEIPHLVKQVFGDHGGLFRQQDEAQWRKAEARLQEALADFAHAARASYQGRLFVEDALQGLRMIDTCREIFDVVVMNPPFGASAANTKDDLAKAYPKSKNDLLAIFVERGLAMMRSGGRIGAITSRTCFFLSSFQKWREGVVLETARPEVMADLGLGIMDDALVEAAAYVLERQ